MWAQAALSHVISHMHGKSLKETGIDHFTCLIYLYFQNELMHTLIPMCVHSYHIAYTYTPHMCAHTLHAILTHSLTCYN